MFARFVTLLPLAALAAVAAAAPNVLEARGTCNNGDVYCCNHKIEKTQYFHGLLGGLLDGLDLNLGLECNTIAVVGALSDQCKQQTVCCQKVEQDGVVNIGCTPIS